MPELRKDPVIGRWVIIASERARRPGNFIDTSDIEPEHAGRSCAFCHDKKEPIQPGSSDTVKVVLFGDTAEDASKSFDRKPNGLYEVIDGVGIDEVVIETPKHVANMADLDVAHIQSVWETYAVRMRALREDQRYQYVLAYKNYGPSAGSRKIGHTRSHIVASPVLPLRVKEKLLGAQSYYNKTQTCIYCDLLHQELQAKERIVYESQHFIALIPFAARFLFELWIIPRAHECDYTNGIKGKEADLAALIKILLQKLQKGLDDPAYNFVIQTAPVKSELFANVHKDYHWHIELMPRLTRAAGFEKGTGFYICAVPPESMAEFLRGVEI